MVIYGAVSILILSNDLRTRIHRTYRKKNVSSGRRVFVCSFRITLDCSSVDFAVYSYPFECFDEQVLLICFK